jgi:V-type H+-transporting ATPase subunit G
VKDAKVEAQKEIEEYRKMKEKEFKKYESEVRLHPELVYTHLTSSQQTSGNKKAEQDADKESEAKLKEIEAAGKKSGSKVVEDLIKAVTTPNPEVPDRASAD